MSDVLYRSRFGPTVVVKARQKGVTNYVNVCRPSRHGNPHTVERWGRAEALRLYMLTMLYDYATSEEYRQSIASLRGKRLGCTCPAEDIAMGRCHAALLSEFVDLKAAVEGEKASK